MKPTLAVWLSYAKAYQIRYGIAPVRNARVNSQIVKFVACVSTDEAPWIAGHYVQNNSARYVAAKHPVGMLLQDAEKLRTEWATGRVVTQGEARNIDERQTSGAVWQGLLRKAEGHVQS